MIKKFSQKAMNSFDCAVLDKLAKENEEEDWQCMRSSIETEQDEYGRLNKLGRLLLLKKIEEMQYKETMITPEDQIRFQCLEELHCFLQEKEEGEKQNGQT